jgi:hypothetical protein
MGEDKRARSWELRATAPGVPGIFSRAVGAVPGLELGWWLGGAVRGVSG